MTYLTTQQAAEALDVDGSTVRRWCQAGKLPGATFVGEGRRKNWMIPADALVGVERDPRGWKRGRPRKESE